MYPVHETMRHSQGIHRNTAPTPAATKPNKAIFTSVILPNMVRLIILEEKVGRLKREEEEGGREREEEDREKSITMQ